MQEDGSKLRDVLVLAAEGAELSFAIEVPSMPRLLDRLAAATGTAQGKVTFGRDQGFATAQVSVAADLTLQCQRCLAPMTAAIRSESQVYLLESEADGARAPLQVETMIAPDGRLRLAELIEEDLLLALPISPRHERRADCALREQTPPPEATAVDVQKPFAALAQLMGRADGSVGTGDEPKRQQARRGRGD